MAKEQKQRGVHRHLNYKGPNNFCGRKVEMCTRHLNYEGPNKFSGRNVHVPKHLNYGGPNNFCGKIEMWQETRQVYPDILIMEVLIISMAGK